VIINGDTKGRHLGNVDRALENVLIPQGYTTFVASPSKPSVSHDHYFSPGPVSRYGAGSRRGPVDWIPAFAGMTCKPE
ncbi:MAG: hypothetical protein Q8P84_02800, partial [Deltaproteobacteria bacterium]|nr:hypothetical protein [Deltaproteobacteria bacterium]